MADPSLTEAAQAAAPHAGFGFFAGGMAGFMRKVGPLHAALSALCGAFIGALAAMSAREWFGIGWWMAALVATAFGLCAIPVVNALLKAADAVAADPWAFAARFWPFKGGK